MRVSILFLLALLAGCQTINQPGPVYRPGEAAIRLHCAQVGAMPPPPPTYFYGSMGRPSGMIVPVPGGFAAGAYAAQQAEIAWQECLWRNGLR